MAFWFQRFRYSFASNHLLTGLYNLSGLRFKNILSVFLVSSAAIIYFSVLPRMHQRYGTGRQLSPEVTPLLSNVNFNVFNNSWQCSLLPIDTFSWIIKIYHDIKNSNNAKFNAIPFEKISHEWKSWWYTVKKICENNFSWTLEKCNLQEK